MPDSDDKKEPILYGPDDKPIPIIEIPEGQATHPAPPEQHIKFRKLRRLKPQRLGLWLLRTTVELVLAFATLIALWQFVVAQPEIRPIDFGAKGPYPARFVVHNPFFLQMYKTQAAVAFSGGVRNGGQEPPDLREPMFKFPGPSACEQL